MKQKPKTPEKKLNSIEKMNALLKQEVRKNGVTKKSTTKVKRQRTWEDWILVGILGASVLMIICAFATQLIDTPAEQTEKELKHLADEYYVTYLYPRLLGNRRNEPAKVLAEYKDVGASTVYLRHLLHYNDDEYAGMAPFFREVGCDTNRTSVRFFPVEPYGPTDYTAYYNIQCKQLTKTEDTAKK